MQQVIRYLFENSNNDFKELLIEDSPKSIFLVTGNKSYEKCGAKNFIENILDGFNFIRFSDFSKNPKIEDVIFLKRRVTRKASFYKFTHDILELVNNSIGYSPEAISFADLSYKDFIKNAFIQNKEKIFMDNIHFSTFAYLDKGDIWTSDNKKIKPLREMFDINTQFLRVVFGQSSILRCSTIRLNKSNASDGFAHTFNNIKFLIR